MQTSGTVVEPEIVDAVPRHHPKDVYHFADYNDGKARRFVSGIHYWKGERCFGSAARRWAAMRGLGVECRLGKGEAWLKFLPEPKRGLRKGEL